MPEKKKFFTTRNVAVVGILSAMAIVLMLLGRFPLISGFAFLEYDPADIVILVTSFLYGPVLGLILTVVTASVQALTVSAASGWYGFLMHIISTGCMVLVVSLIYNFKKTKLIAAISLAAAVIVTTGVMLVSNYFVTPLFMQMSTEDIKALLVPVFLPFNLIKGCINAVATFLIYKPVSKIVKR